MIQTSLERILTLDDRWVQPMYVDVMCPLCRKPFLLRFELGEQMKMRDGRIAIGTNGAATCDNCHRVMYYEIVNPTIDVSIHTIDGKE